VNLPDRGRSLWICLTLALLLFWPAFCGAEVRELTLPECVNLALRANTDAAKGRLDRLLSRLDRQIGQDYFQPDLYLTPGSDYETDEERRWRLGLDATIVQRLPTGGQIRFDWDNSYNRYTGEDEEDWTSGVEVKLSQPLLRGAGIEVGTSPVVMSGWEDDEDRWGFEWLLTRLITQVQKRYWDLLYANESLGVAQGALERSRRLFEEGRAKATATELVELESEAADAELEVYDRSLAVTGANLRLLDLMDVEDLTGVRPKGGFEFGPVALDVERFLEIALEQRPDLKQYQVGVEIARLKMIVADSRAKTDLDLAVSASSQATEERFAQAFEDAYNLSEEWVIGLEAEIRLGVPGRKREAAAAGYRLDKAELNLAERTQSVRNDVITAVESLKASLKSIELAQRASGLAQRKLAAAEEGFLRGEADNLKVLIYQRDLTSARLKEYRAIVNYLYDLAELDESMGNTLSTWQVEIGP